MEKQKTKEPSKVDRINDFIDKSVEVRYNRNNVTYRKQIEEFDAKYLSDDEKSLIKQLDAQEKKSIGASRYNAAKAAFGGVKMAVGGPISQAFGAINASSGSQDIYQSEKTLHDIANAKQTIRSEAELRQTKRYEQAQNVLPHVEQAANERSSEAEFE